MTRSLSASVLALALAAALPASAQTDASTGEAEAPADSAAAAATEAPAADAAASGASGTGDAASAAGDAAAADPAAEDAAATDGATEAAESGDAAADASASGGLEAAEPTGTYALDPEHTHIVWSYEHTGFSTSTSVVRGVNGTVTLNPDDPSQSTVEASFPLSSLVTVSALLDEHMMGADFFDGDAPDTLVTYRSTSVEPTGEMTATVTGDLTLNEMTVPLTLEVELRQSAVNPIEKVPAVGFRATGTLKRSDFGLGAFAPAVSDEVEIVINAEALKR